MPMQTGREDFRVVEHQDIAFMQVFYDIRELAMFEFVLLTVNDQQL